VNSAL
jgi:pimeloyl-ACP methyl ester carboxylesterase